MGELVGYCAAVSLLLEATSRLRAVPAAQTQGMKPSPQSSALKGVVSWVRGGAGDVDTGRVLRGGQQGLARQHRSTHCRTPQLMLAPSA